MGFTVISRDLILKLKRFSLERVKFNLGSESHFEKEVIRHPGAVVMLVIDDQNRIILVQQPRVALEIETLEVPAGTLNLQEVPLEAAKRELAEEVGLKADEWLSLGQIYAAPGFCDEKLHLFMARNLSEYKLAADPEEQIGVLRFSLQQLEQLIIDGKIDDSKTLAIIFKAKLLELIY
jgi:ADP-ribose pyrophosphatase